MRSIDILLNEDGTVKFSGPKKFLKKLKLTKKNKLRTMLAMITLDYAVNENGHFFFELTELTAKEIIKARKRMKHVR